MSSTDVKVWKRYDDGYLVRSMTLEDVKIVQKWYCEMGNISPYDMNTAFNSYPPGSPGFYVGEYNGHVVSSAIRIPWGNGVFYGSMYYVDKNYRGTGFGTRLRDEVAREYVGENILCIDAVEGSVAKKNEEKFGYVTAFETARYVLRAPETEDIKTDNFKIVKASDVAFGDIIAYDNKNFVSKDFEPRRKFLQTWISIPDGASYVALNNQEQIVGLGCRRSCFVKGNHMVGPLYADTTEIAEELMKTLCHDVAGSSVTINIWSHCKAAQQLVEKYKAEKVFSVVRMHVNGDPKEFKPTTVCLTSIDVCGF